MTLSRSDLLRLMESLRTADGIESIRTPAQRLLALGAAACATRKVLGRA
ncbi:hypothetical protein ACFV0O_01950 [Kitasatospora sp. NPDC059577]